MRSQLPRAARGLLAAVGLMASLALAAAPAPQDDPGPGDGLEELRGGGLDIPGAPNMTREQIAAHAAAAAARAPQTLEEFRAFEARVRKTAARVRPSVVGLLLEHGGQQGAGSGVIISADGWVATAAHVGLEPGVKVRVLLADGTELPGVTAGQHLDRNQDVGLVKVDAGGRELPFVPLGTASDLMPGDALLVFGHPLGPELKPWRPPPLRVGQVLARDGTVLGMDAPVTPGDSGGPVFDIDGRLVGITSVASHRPDVNACVTVDLLKDKLEGLKRGERTGMQVGPDGEVPVIVALDRSFAGAASRAQHERRDAVHTVLSPLVFDAANSVVTVMVDARAAALGVVVDDQGHVLTKASEVGVGPRVVQAAMPDGTLVSARRIARNDRLDLMLLATGTDDNDVIELADEDPEWGSAIISVGNGIAPAAVGFRSLGPYNAGASDQASRSFMGVTLEARADGVMVSSVFEASGAAEAGLREGDVLLKVDGVEMASPDSAADALRSRAPGDRVTVEFMRGGESKTASVRLQRTMFDLGPGNIGAAVSRRGTGFGPVIQHDGIVPAEAMGAPIVDSQGRVVGLNIARAERTKTYALSSAVLKPAIAELLEAAARGESAEPPDLRTVLPAVKFREDGRAVLTAGGARLFGPTLVLAGDDDFAALDGWASPEDVAVWALQVPDFGRYEIHLDLLPMLGGNVDVFIDGELFTVRVPQGTGDETAFQVMRAGESFIDTPSTVILRVQPLDRPHGPIMRLREVRVARLETLRMFEQVMPVLRYRDMERMKREIERDQARELARKANEFVPPDRDAAPGGGASPDGNAAPGNGAAPGDGDPQ